MSAASIRALVSGYPRRLWSSKLLVMLQAYCDDSEGSTGDRRLFLAAYVHTAEKWIEFAEEWDAVLRAEPSIEYFKMVEATSRRDQFRGFSEKKRDRKIFELAGVIQKFAPWGLHTSVSTKAFREILQPHVPFPMATPYYPLTFGILFGIARVHATLGVNVPCKFSFDHRDGLAAKVVPLFELMMESLPGDWNQLVSGTPTFDDDKDLVPLQAADMLAWHIRREHEGNYPAKLEPLRRMLTVENGHFYTDVTTEVLERLADGFRQIPNVATITTKKQWARLLPALLEDFDRAKRGEPSIYAAHREANHPPD